MIDNCVGLYVIEQAALIEETLQHV